jgi:hypothetical protein
MSLSGLSGYLDIPNANLRVAGAVQTGTINVGSARIFATYDLDVVTAKGNTTPYTIGFSNATTGLATTSNAQIGGNLTVSSNLTVGGSVSSNLELASNLILNEDLFLVGNTQIRNNSNVVTEFTGPHGRPQATLTKFPEIQMTEKAKAGYVVSASSSLSNNSPHYAFDNDIGATSGEVYSWQSGAVNYDTSGGGWLGGTGAAYSTTIGGTTYYGEWIQLKLPVSIDLSHVDIYPQTHASVDLTGRTPQTGKLVGSTNGTTWVLLKDFTLTQPPETGYSRIDVATANYYTYFRLVAETTFGGVYGNYTGFAEMKLFGTPQVETAGDISQDTTLKSIYNTPSNLDANVYLDGDLGATLTNQISGGPALTGTGATYDSAGKYWSLDGSTESNVVTGDLAFQGDQPHSVSLWFNSSNLEANVANSTIYHIGTAAATGDATHKVRIVNKSLSWNYENDLPLKANTWHHLTHTYGGVGGYRTLYLDGRKVESAYAGDTAGEFPPFPMSGYSQGGYTASASSEYDANYRAWEAFNNIYEPNGDAWMCENNNALYPSAGNYAYNGSRQLASNTPLGEWLKLELRYKLVLSHIRIVARDGQSARAPEDFKIFGSNDNITWSEILSETGVAPGEHDGTPTYYDADTTTNAYKYFAMVITRTVSSENAGLAEWELYGHKENDLIRFPDATNVRKYPDTAMASHGPQKGYTVSGTGEISTGGEGSYTNYYAFLAFNQQFENNYDAWHSDPDYDSGTGNYNGAIPSVGRTTVGATNYDGHYIQLQLPNRVKVSYLTLQPQYGSTSDFTSRLPKDFIVFGSNNGSSWNVVKSITGVTGIESVDTTVNIDSSDYYQYFRLLVTKNGGNSYTTIGKLQFYGTEVAEPVLARLGGAFEGKVANFRVYNKCIKEDQALELWDAQKDQFGLAKSSVTVYKGRVGIGTTEPQAALTVADEVAIPKSGEFPPGPMTNYETHFKDHGLFRASSTGEVNTTFPTWKVFGDTWYGDSPYHSWEGNISYSTSTGYLTTPATAPITNGIAGAWVQLELPYTILLTSWSFTPERRATLDNVGRDRAPQDGYLFGSTDGSTWSVVENWTGRVSWADGHTSIFNVTTSTYYKYFRLVWTRTRPGGTYSATTAAGNLSFFGTPETTTKYSTLHDGELTLTKSLNVPRIGPALSEEYPTPHRDKLMLEYNTALSIHESAAVDTSGNHRTGDLNSGAIYSPNSRAFEFNTTNDHLRENTSDMVGNAIHTFSFWINFNEVTSSRHIIWMGVNTDFKRINFHFNGTNNTFSYNFRGRGVSLVKDDMVPNRWYHIVLTYDGNGFSNNCQKIYIDGILQDSIDSGTGDLLNIDNSADLYIGGTISYTATHGYYKISMFRIWNGVALNAGEVMTLYNQTRTPHTNNLVIEESTVVIGSSSRRYYDARLEVEGKIRAMSSFISTFTGQHRCVPEGPMEPGLIVSADKNRYVNLNGGLKTGSEAITIDESLPVVALSNVSQDKSCFGVVSSVEGVGTSRSETKGGFISETPKVLGDNRAIVNSLGEGALWVVNTGGPLESGDYVTTSNVAGYGQRQDDDVLHNYTVAKITMDCDFTASNVATQAPKKVETLVTVEEGVWSNLSAYNRSSETQTQYINGENVVLTEGEWSNLATEEQNTYSDTTITTYYEIRRGENLLDENGNIQWEDTDGVEPGYKVRFLTSDGTQTDEANAVHIAAFVGCTYHCG